MALNWLAAWPETARGEAGRGFVLFEVAVPSLLSITAMVRRYRVGVIIGMDPHKRSATIEVVDDERGSVLAKASGSASFDADHRASNADHPESRRRVRRNRRRDTARDHARTTCMWVAPTSGTRRRKLHRASRLDAVPVGADTAPLTRITRPDRISGSPRSPVG